MNTIYLSDKPTAPLPPQAATIGFFDGVHRGHQYLIQSVRDVASATGMSSMAITFDRHPRQVLHADYQPQLLSDHDEKLRLIERTGVDNCTVLHFDRTLASLTARQFMRSVLRQRLNVRALVIGYDNRFGHNRSEGFEDYVRYGQQLGIEVIQSDALKVSDIGVSSSVVRRLLAEGDVEKARLCLGRPYTVTGNVVGGHQEGRRIGFPTANISMEGSMKLVPEAGVYAVRVRIDGSAETHDAMMNIGHRPTYDGTETTLEAHLLDFTGDLYGKRLTVFFLHRLRDERRFASPEALREQLLADRETVRRIFMAEP